MADNKNISVEEQEKRVFAHQQRITELEADNKRLTEKLAETHNLLEQEIDYEAKWHIADIEVEHLSGQLAAMQEALTQIQASRSQPRGP